LLSNSAQFCFLTLFLTEIAQLTQETQAFTQQKLLPQLNNKHNHSSATWH